MWIQLGNVVHFKTLTHLIQLTSKMYIIDSLEGGPNGASNFSDDAGLEDMVNLANSQLQHELQHSDKLSKKNILGKTEDVSTRPSPENVAHENFLLPINVKRFALYEPEPMVD